MLTENVKQLEFLKLDSRHGITSNETRRDVDFMEMARRFHLRESEEGLLAKVRGRKNDDEKLSLWIGEQKKLKSLKLQFLNVIPTRMWAAKPERVRLRACQARLYWEYLMYPNEELRKLIIEAPSSIMLEETERQDDRTIEDVRRHELRTCDILSVPSWMSIFRHPVIITTDQDPGRDYLVQTMFTQNVLEPLPLQLSLSANNGSSITHLTLRVFTVQNNDLTHVLRPFTNLTYLNLAMTHIETLPMIPSLTTLVLRDILLQGRFNIFNNVLNSIRNCDALTTLTLDNVLYVERQWQPSRSRNVRSLSPTEPYWSQRVNQSVRNLTLGFYARNFLRGSSAEIQDLERFLGALTTMFPSVAHLTLNYMGETESWPMTGMQPEGWSLQTIRVRIKDVAVDVERRNAAAIRGCEFLNQYFPGVPEKLVLIQCAGTYRREPSKFFYDDDEDTAITYSYTAA
jgi:hypothetical protein